MLSLQMKEMLQNFEYCSLVVVLALNLTSADLSGAAVLICLTTQRFSTG